jgi:FtsP/CotA-like multicopper oxidase with cupredoxin domain
MTISPMLKISLNIVKKVITSDSFMSTEKKISKFPNRRQFIYGGLGAGLGIGGSIWAWQQLGRSRLSDSTVPLKGETHLPKPQGDPSNPLVFLRNFDYGTIKQENGRTIREFRVEARTSTLQLNNAVSLISWNLNGQVPAPTLRATEGDRIRVIFFNNITGKFPAPWGV